MADIIEIVPNFNVELLYSPSEFYNPVLSLTGLISLCNAKYKYPDDTDTYRFVMMGDLNFIQNTATSYNEPCIPFIQLIKHSNPNYVEIKVNDVTDTNATSVNDLTSTVTGVRWYDKDVQPQTIPANASVDSYLSNNVDWTSVDWTDNTYGYPFYLNTNIPIFEVTQELSLNDNIRRFMTRSITAEKLVELESDVISIINTKAEEIEKDYYIYNEYQHGTASLLEGFVPDEGAMLFRKYETIKAKGGYLALVRQEDSSYSIVNNGATIIGSFYGNHTKYDLHAYPNVIQQTTGFYNYWDGFTIGSINVASLLDTNMDIYGNATDYQDVIDGRKKPEDVAENYKKKDKGDGKENNTGNKEKETTLGKPNFETFFVNQYILTLNQARDLADALFLADATQIALIKEAISTFFANPIEAIADITYYPFNVADYVTSLTNEVTIGRWQSGVNGKKIFKREATIDVGSIYFRETYGNFRDYQTKITIYLPYIGVHTLEASKYLNHNIRIKYGVDLFTHQCTAFIFADDILIDYFSGNMGVTMPITATNFSQYASGFIDYAKGSVGNVSQGSLAGQVGSIEGLWKNVPENMRETKGSFSPSIGCYAPQYVRICFESLVSDDNETYTNSLRGIPSNATGSISSFSGFLSVSDVNLVCSNATASEKDEIRSLLDSGIYIRG